MKKTILLLICTATLGLVSCKKDTIIQETPNRTFVYTVQPNQWTLTNDGETYTTELRIDEIDQISIDDEGTLVYVANPSTANIYRQLPYVYNVDAYSYEIYPGGIKISIESSDFQNRNPIRPTQSVQVKIVLIPSVFVP
jgi:hypothetical protein